MNNRSCTNNKHQYGLWNIDKKKNIVYRSCGKCGNVLKLPITEEVVMEIVKQEEASKIFKAFQLVSDSDENLINYLELILEDYINYLGQDDYASLIKRIRKLEKDDIIDAKSIVYQHQLGTYFEINNDDIDDNKENAIDNELVFEQV